MRYALVCGHNPLRLDGCEPRGRPAYRPLERPTEIQQQALLQAFFSRISSDTNDGVAIHGPEDAGAIHGNGKCRIVIGRRLPNSRLLTFAGQHYVPVKAPPRSGMGTVPNWLDWVDTFMAPDSENDSGRDDDASSPH